MQDELTKKNRDQLDTIYNLDMDNFSSSMNRMFSLWDDGISSAKAEISAITGENEAKWKALAEWQDDTEQSIASISGTVTSQGATLRSIASWQTATEENIAAIELLADENGSSIKQIVSSVGADGKVNAASIVASIIGDESSIKLLADEIVIEGNAEFVTKDSLYSGTGTTTISGNNIKLSLPFVADVSSDEAAEAEAHILFAYDPEYENVQMAKIYTKFDGSGGADGEITDDAKFALVIQTDTIRHVYDENSAETYNTALKLSAAGSMSLESKSEASGIYMMSYGYTTIDADYNTRIRANGKYSTTADSVSDHPAATNDYVFATDGIYYNGTKILST